MEPKKAETVLLVDKDEIVRLMVADMLKMYGYKVVISGSGDKAMRWAEKFEGPIHLLLTDVLMPVVSGTALAVRLGLKRKDQQPPMKVLYMAGLNDDLTIQYSVVQTGGGLLRKPFTPDTLGRKVREVLDT